MCPLLAVVVIGTLLPRRRVSFSLMPSHATVTGTVKAPTTCVRVGECEGFVFLHFDGEKDSLSKYSHPHTPTRTQDEKRDESEQEEGRCGRLGSCSQSLSLLEHRFNCPSRLTSWTVVVLNGRRSVEGFELEDRIFLHPLVEYLELQLRILGP